MFDYFNSEEKQFVLDIFPDAYVKVSSAPNPYDVGDVKYYRIMSPAPISKHERSNNRLIGHGENEAKAWANAKRQSMHILKEMLSE